MRKKSMKADEFDKRFDNGGDIIKYLDFKKVKRKLKSVKNAKKDSGIAPQKERDKPE